MTRTPPIALALAALLAAQGAALSAEAPPALRFPVVDLARDPLTGPAYRADRIELRVAAGAVGSLTGRSIRTPALARPHLARLGIEGADRVADALGAWFEPEFAGESPPAAGSGEPDFTTFYIVHLPAGTDIAGALARFRAAPEIASADPIGVLPLSAIPNDSLWSASWWFDQVSGHDIHAPAAWDVTIGDTSIAVAILDTGVLPYHPDLGGTRAGLRGQVWTNWAEQGGLPGVDDDANGYVDDNWGWDFVANANAFTGEDGREEDNDPNDFAGHGTFVAGLVGALTDNTIGVSGTAWQVRLMAVRIGWSDAAFPIGAVDMSYVAQGIRYATRMGASVINCSFATLNQSGLYAAVDAAVMAGVTIVAASGNGGQPHELADREDVIAVAATDANDQVAGFSNLGTFVDLCAPGVLITSTYVAHVASDSIGERQPAYAANMSGTSFAAPQVAGAVALLQARQKQLGNPPLTPMGAVLRLRETADDISADNPAAAGYGTGRLNLFRALTDPPGSRVSRGGATTIGPPVILPGTSGNARLAYVTSDAKLVIVDALSGDTLALTPIGAVPARQLAGADLGNGRGVGLFVGTTNGRMYGFDSEGAPRTGWPRTGAGPFAPLDGGPALGDIDGDGELDVVCGSADGSVFAWHADGVRVAGFPVLLDASGVDRPVALAPLDTLAGVEIVAVTNLGDIHVLSGDGSEPSGWPQTLALPHVAPMVVGLGKSAKPAVLVVAGNQVIAFAPDGTQRWSATLSGSALQDPAAADLDRDGSDEILIATFAPSALAVLDSAGVALSSRGFPVALPALPQGPVVVGPLRPGGAPAALIMCGSALMAFTDSATSLQRFPEPGNAGTFPEIAELEADGQTEIAAGSGADSLLYIYAAGPGTWASLASSWPAPRANDARTGSRLYAPGIPPRDDIAPAAIADLVATWARPESVVVRWTAPGGDGVLGRAASYELRVTPDSLSALDFSLGSRTDLAPPDDAGTPQRFAFATTAFGTRLFLAMRSRDAVGNVAAPSNVAALLTGNGGVALAVRGQPARVPAYFEWQGGSPGVRPEIRIFDLMGRRVRTLALPTDRFGGTVEWNGRDDEQRAVPAGLYFARLTCGSIHAQTRVVLLP